MAALQSSWSDIEKNETQTSAPVFFEWFCQYQAENMKLCMLKPVRVNMGLGKILKEYTNNANESMNARIKEKVNYKRSELRQKMRRNKLEKLKELVQLMLRGC